MKAHSGREVKTSRRSNSRRRKFLLRKEIWRPLVWKETAEGEENAGEAYTPFTGLQGEDRREKPPELEAACTLKKSRVTALEEPSPIKRKVSDIRELKRPGGQGSKGEREGTCLERGFTNCPRR